MQKQIEVHGMMKCLSALNAGKVETIFGAMVATLHGAVIVPRRPLMLVRPARDFSVSIVTVHYQQNLDLFKLDIKSGNKCRVKIKY